MALLIYHPNIARIDCEDCKKWVYSLEEGCRLLHPPGARGKPVANAVGPPCERDSKICAKGHWSTAKPMSLKNWVTYNHYLTCRSVNQFPDDAIVRQNAAIIRSVEDGYDRRR